MKINLFKVITILIIIKSFLWMFTIPIFQSPDEASHFAYIQRIAETNKAIHPRKDDTNSQELIEVAEILNFNWGKSHPVWQGYQQDWKKKIEQIQENKRREFVKMEQRTVKNPPLYYWLASSFYKLFYGQTFLYRFFALRFFSLLISLLTVFLTYKIGLLIFMKPLRALLLTSLVAFQPMFSFQTVTINNDVLAIFIGTLFLYLGIKAIKEKRNKFYFLTFLVILCGLFIKPQLVLFLFVFPLILGKKILKGTLVVILTLLIILVSGWLIFDINKASHLSPAFLDKIRYKIAFNDYKEHFFFLLLQMQKGTLGQDLGKYFSENKEVYLNNLFPWYWGVFGWLEATMPLLVYRTLKVICILSGFGLILWLVRNFNGRTKSSFQIVIFLLWVIIVFSLGIIFNDFKVFSTTGQAFGIQGRYFLPVISAHMILLFLGIKTLVGEKCERWIYPLLIFSSITLNIIGFWTMYRYFWL